MRSENEMKQFWIQQMAQDFSCSLQQITCKENVFVKKTEEPGRRKFKGENSNLKVLCTNGKLVFAAEEKLLSWCVQEYADYNGAWFAEFSNLSKMDQKLREVGYYLADFHHFYLPFGVSSMDEQEKQKMERKYEVNWYEQDEIEQFRGNASFTNALSFNEMAPDVLAVTASIDGQVLGMAGVSADSEMFYQIGIDVLKTNRGSQIGPYLTTLLKEEVLKRGKIPFYGTVESHIQSQKVAIKSGFVPAWAEMYSMPVV